MVLLGAWPVGVCVCAWRRCIGRANAANAGRPSRGLGWTGVGGLEKGAERGWGVNPHVVTRLVGVDVSSVGVVDM